MSEDWTKGRAVGLRVGGPTAPADLLVRAGAVGALVGGTAALAIAARKLKDQEITRDEALRKVLIGAARSGVATGLGALVASSLRGNPLLSATAMVATGAAVLYVMDGAELSKAAPKTQRKA
ncbi:magnetosome protein MamC [Rhodospirillum rubrum]|uniref:Transmembrane protein n=1 Tax=Rhodospirillum rubrum (strain ATCC 11170 / ATH 1.1.1 / DSM 467 / LMG 4362 / NCIMB 8255 / S1) TaxID=269796 RepID=Q2RQK0_RHORT|nr:magnetosome protein MamC [Rhodospirillum rubrum]ABC23595.1 hypothetical protein Rru_A2798 [Rhodospirillum rubrum ATCC 11170]AEO49333.1 hypothetical protein F11_14355 [Rhodospirillum rubrum F11]MBK1663898.1 hypothetical protein [Rhodospirillum rubrum]MBK1676737.1 hypothetical protein [Rhodospirillum rubrum]MBK5955270.1 hypothetical protein [Rhodospirillum rubrum]